MDFHRIMAEVSLMLPGDTRVMRVQCVLEMEVMMQTATWDRVRALH